jgi:cell division protein FtsB
VTQRQHGGVLSSVLIVAVLVAVVATAAGIFPFRQIIADRRSVALAQEKLLALRAENARLENQVAALQGDTEVQRLAREQFGLVRPEEVAYVVVSPEGEQVVTPEPEPTLAGTKGRPWWRSLWDFLTGRDLVPDG